MWTPEKSQHSPGRKDSGFDSSILKHAQAEYARLQSLIVDFPLQLRWCPIKGKFTQSLRSS